MAVRVQQRLQRAETQRERSAATIQSAWRAHVRARLARVQESAARARTDTEDRAARTIQVLLLSRKKAHVEDCVRRTSETIEVAHTMLCATRAWMYAQYMGSQGTFSESHCALLWEHERLPRAEHVYINPPCCRLSRHQVGIILGVKRTSQAKCSGFETLQPPAGP